MHFHKFRNFSSIFATFETNCFIPINFMAGTYVRNTLFHFCQLPPVKMAANLRLYGKFSLILIGSVMFGATFRLVSRVGVP